MAKRQIAKSEFPLRLVAGAALAISLLMSWGALATPLSPVSPVAGNGGDGAVFCAWCLTTSAAPRASAPHEAARAIRRASQETAKRRRAQGRSSADRLGYAAFAAAARCRDFAPHKKRKMRLSLKRIYNSCKSFGAQNAYRSKGWCARGVTEALSEAGIRISRGHARYQRPKLIAAGFTKTKYNPETLPNGSIVVCNGGHSSGCGRKGRETCGHMEIVSIRNNERWFCSDFCSRTPTCDGGSYSQRTAFKFPGM